MFVPIRLVLRRCEATNLGVFDLWHFALISPYSNGAVQIRVGLELADCVCLPPPRGFPRKMKQQFPPTPNSVNCRFLSGTESHSLWIYPCPPFRDHGLNPPLSTENPRNKGLLGLERPFLDLVSQTPRPRGRGRPSEAINQHLSSAV